MGKRELTKAEMAAKISALTRQVKSAKTRAGRFTDRWVEAGQLNLLYYDYIVATIEFRPPVARESLEAEDWLYSFELRCCKGVIPEYYVVELVRTTGDEPKSYVDLYLLAKAASHFSEGQSKAPYSRFAFKSRTIPDYQDMIGKLIAAKTNHEQSADSAPAVSGRGLEFAKWNKPH
ncbi:MAG TPA: hypothetical protein VJH03_02755 [Blastocatellia bacterium]|nr:hypothetical protein [Blastocatellia bacterium]